MNILVLLRKKFHIQASENQFEIVQKNNTISLEKNDEKNMFYPIAHRILREQINIYSKDTNINHAHDIFNHMSEQVLEQKCKEHNISLTGKLQACPGYLYAKAKMTKIMKATNIRATTAGERLFMDTSGWYPLSIGGNKYCCKVVDNHSRKNWNYLMKRKNDLVNAQNMKCIFLCRMIFYFILFYVHNLFVGFAQLFLDLLNYLSFCSIILFVCIVSYYFYCIIFCVCIHFDVSFLT